MIIWIIIASTSLRISQRRSRITGVQPHQEAHRLCGTFVLHALVLIIGYKPSIQQWSDGTDIDTPGREGALHCFTPVRCLALIVSFINKLIPCIWWILVLLHWGRKNNQPANYSKKSTILFLSDIQMDWNWFQKRREREVIHVFNSNILYILTKRNSQTVA